MVATYGPAPGATPDPDYSPANVDWEPSRLAVTVHEVGTDDLIATPVARWAPKWMDCLDEEGSFSLNVQADDSAAALIRRGMLVRFWIDGVARWTGVIKRRKVIARGQGALRFVALAGHGQVRLLDRIKVYPSGGLGRFPFADERTFDWTAPEFDDSGWDPVVVTPANYGLSTENYGLPEGFPDGDAEWIWDEDSSGAVAAGTKQMRGSGTALTTRVREAWSASDDTNTVWINGVHHLRSPDTAYVGRTTAVETLVSAGQVVVAAEVENLNALKAGFLFSLLTPLDDSEAPTIHTDDTWLVRPTGAPLGMNAGEIMLTLLDEADARGTVIPTVTFDAALDSNGNAWSSYEQLTVQCGDSAWTVLTRMVGLDMCEFRMSPDGYELNLYNRGEAGGDSGFTLTDYTTLEHDEVDLEATALLTRFALGFRESEDTALSTAEGRREDFLSLGGVRSNVAAAAQAEDVIASLAANLVSTSFAYDPATRADEPYNAFLIGEGVTVENIDGDPELQRVLQVETTVDATGLPVFTVGANSVHAEQRKRQQVMLTRLANGTVGGRASSSTAPIQPRSIEPPEPSTVVWSEGGPVVPVVGVAKTFERAIRVRELRVDVLTTSSSGDISVDLLKNGTTVATATVAAGDLQGYVPVTDVVFSQRPADVMQVEVTDPGTGADSITITVVYA